MFETAAGNERIRILDRAHDAADAGIDQCLGTRRRLAVMVVRFERNISRTAAGKLSGLLKGDRLGVDDAVKRVRALADDIAVSRHDDASDKRIGADEPASGGGEFECTPEICNVRCFGHRIYARGYLFGRRRLPRYFSSGLLPVIIDVHEQLFAESSAAVPLA